MPSDSFSPFPSPPDTPVSTVSPASPQALIRLAGTADSETLCAWLQSRQPLPVAATRARQALVEGLLARPERGACVLAEAAAGLVGCLPVALVPHLGLAGLAALATEWWDDGTPSQDAAVLLACCDLLADWCRAHGVRHLLLAPGLLAASQAAAAGFLPQAGGLWHRNLSPAPKTLG
ncbi:hypothetical protein P3W85_16215 [Cupriavidus basilensis]|uniref:N-acetyltransferase domain-containing protein n=1 Tax=Cupriavidus basilensis TaxID=68895 RepID=A0ABT6APE9_9BURK|nr:hypothetical protein [Cupriavidus basilensis]MDF3834487.1 hypothetical protein [Cupriavidus basilensis]